MGNETGVAPLSGRGQASDAGTADLALDPQPPRFSHCGGRKEPSSCQRREAF